MIKEYDVYEFTYNGLMGTVEETLADYTAQFKCWTPDPGICKCECSDGIERLIPTFALCDFSRNDVEEQSKTGIIFGSACKS